MELEIRGEVPRDGGRGAILWQRILRYNELESIWLIQDRILGDVVGPVSWAFPFAPGARFAAGDSGGVLTLASGRRFRLDLDPVGELAVESGWVAPAYGERVPVQVLRRRIDPAPARADARITPLD